MHTPIDDRQTEEQQDQNVDNNQKNSETKDSTEKIFRIQASAKHLELVSPVFKKLLTGGWKETAELQDKGRVEITIEDWDIEALLILLRIIHCRHDNIPRTVSLEVLAKIALLVDYYQCRESVKFFTDIWISDLTEKETVPMQYSRKVILWLWVSGFFFIQKEFEYATSTVMTSSSGLINSLGLPIHTATLSKDWHFSNSI